MSDAAILLKVASRTVIEARDAWRKAQAAGTETNLRAAFRACVLAARSSRRAADAWSGDRARRLTEEAKRLDATAIDLKARLARVAA